MNETWTPHMRSSIVSMEQNQHITRMFCMAVSGGCVGIIYHLREHTVLLGTQLKHTLCLENTEVSLNFHIQTPCHSHRTLSIQMLYYKFHRLLVSLPLFFLDVSRGLFCPPALLLQDPKTPGTVPGPPAPGQLWAPVGLGLTRSSDWTVYETDQPFSC